MKLNVIDIVIYSWAQIDYCDILISINKYEVIWNVFINLYQVFLPQ